MNMRAETHNIAVAYLIWILGFTGCHRFYFGKRITGVIWFFTLGLLGVGWVIDFFLIPSMSRHASFKYAIGKYDYSLCWLLLVFGGVFGFHRFYMGKWGTGLLYLLTGGLFGLGYLYDLFTLNVQLHGFNRYTEYSSRIQYA